MKKIYTIMLVALLSASTSAQQVRFFQGKQSGRQKTTTVNNTAVSPTPLVMPAAPIASPMVRVSQNPAVKLAKIQSQAATNGKLLTSYAQPTDNGMEGVSVVRSYSAIGTNYKTKDTESWTMTMGTVETGSGTKSVIVDFLPSPFASIEHIRVNYTEKDGTITIPAQLVTQTTDDNENPVYIYLHSGVTEDGSIVLNIVDEQGHIELANKNDDILYGIWAVENPTFDEDDYDENYMGYVLLMENIRFMLPDEIPAPIAMFEPRNLILYTGVSDDGYSFTYQHVMYPAYAPVSYRNLTSDLVDKWSWQIYDIAASEEEGVTFTDGELLYESSDKEMVYTTTGSTQIRPVRLTASYKGVVSEPFSDTEDDAILYAGGIGEDWQFEDGSTPVLSRGQLKNGLAYYNGMGTSDGIHTYILYQGKPSAPLYIEGVTMQCAGFTAKEGFNLTCKLQKVTREEDGHITLGDVIAQSAVDTKRVEQSTWGVTQLYWDNFLIYDELGFEKVLDYLFLEDEFAIVIEGWDNGTFEGYPLCDKGTDNGVPSIHVIESGSEEYEGRAFWSYYGNFFTGFINAASGYLYTEDDTDLIFGADGGTTSIHVDPMLYAITEDTEEPTHLLGIEPVLEDDEEADEIPEWVTIEIANEDYTKDDDGYFVNGIDYDMVITTEALPEGVENRTCQIVFFQTGAKLTVNITQNVDPDGITTVVEKTPIKNSRAFNLAGQPVKNYKGVVVKDGKKTIYK